MGDYMICSPDLLHKIEDFTIGIFYPLLSDKHSPLKVSINLENNSQENSSPMTDERNVEECITKCKWDNSKKVEFQNSFDESKINAIFQTLSSTNITEVSQDSLDNLTNDLKETFMEPAKKKQAFTHKIGL